jgi:hypothetical protein
MLSEFNDPLGLVVPLSSCRLVSGRAIWLSLVEIWVGTPGKCYSPPPQTALFHWDASQLKGRESEKYSGVDIWVKGLLTPLTVVNSFVRFCCETFVCSDIILLLQKINSPAQAFRYTLYIKWNMRSNVQYFGCDHIPFALNPLHCRKGSPCLISCLLLRLWTRIGTVDDYTLSQHWLMPKTQYSVWMEWYPILNI